MAVKIIAVGNRLMGDEGVAIKLAEALDEELISQGIEVVIGGTDIDCCLDSIDSKDIIIILDATCYGLEPGAITVIPISRSNLCFSHFLTQHDLNMLKLFEKTSEDLFGYLVGIEVVSINFSQDLSKALKEKFPAICKKVNKVISVLKNNPVSRDLVMLLSKL